jgi:signal transduction histidine kinase
MLNNLMDRWVQHPCGSPHMFDRLYRVESARSSALMGLDLGLANVKGISMRQLEKLLDSE